MPIAIESRATEQTVYGHPFIEILATDEVRVDISDLTTAEVDADGYLKPGAHLRKTGDTIASGSALYGVTIEPTKIVAAAPTDASLAANTGTFPVVVGTIGFVNRDVVEDNLGRALTADEIASYDIAGSKLHLSRT